jgi:epoxyqueuosine reductase
MAFLEEQLAVRLDPTRVLAGAKSAIMVADLYSARGTPPERPLAAGRGRVARYVRGRDYHWTIKKRLHALCDELRPRHAGHAFRSFVDTAPVLEREFAARAGMGWIGKHTLLIHPRIGSYTLLGGVLTTLELPALPDHGSVQDHCGTCTRCIDACPTGAITPYSVDATRCVSYLTIERRGPIDARLHAGIGDRLFGCDVCQDVCPHNSPRPAGVDATDDVRAEYAPRVDSFDLLSVLSWKAEDRRTAFEGSALKRATLAMMKRNAVIVIGNILAGYGAQPVDGDWVSRATQRLSEIAADPAEHAALRALAERMLGGADRRR